MRILIANESARMIGGTEKYLRTLIPALAHRGHKLGLVHGDVPQEGDDTLDPGGYCVRWPFAQLGLDRTLAEVKAWAPDLLFAHGLVSPVLECELLRRYTSIFYAHGYYGTCATGSKVHSFPFIRPCERRLGPMCLLLHMPLRCGGLNPLTALRDYQVQMKRSHFLQLHASVLVANSHMKEEFVRNGVKPEKVFTLPLPIDEASSKPHYRSFESRPLSGRILFMGRLTKLKGVGCLFPALEMAQKRLGFQLHLTVAGSGPEDVRLREAATRLPFTVDFAGWVDRKGQEALFEISDLLVVPSLWPEPFGLVGLEAAVFGVPAVAFNVGGISSWLESGSNGELAPGNPPTAEGLSDAIERALSDPDHHTALCKRAVQKALQFSTNAHVEALQSILMASVQ